MLLTEYLVPVGRTLVIPPSETRPVFRITPKSIRQNIVTFSIVKGAESAICARRSGHRLHFHDLTITVCNRPHSVGLFINHDGAELLEQETGK